MNVTREQIEERATRMKRLIARRVRESRSKSRFQRVRGKLMKKPVGTRRGFERMFADIEAAASRLVAARDAEQSARRLA